SKQFPIKAGKEDERVLKHKGRFSIILLNQRPRKTNVFIRLLKQAIVTQHHLKFTKNGGDS
ncbi:MAG: hypothetical protein LZ171_02520, partial [Thaumarchaeota archaeon]|nr:hypothetical protein [Candidatus Geocrenenecus arthurdayi]